MKRIMRKRPLRRGLLNISETSGTTSLPMAGRFASGMASTLTDTLLSTAASSLQASSICGWCTLWIGGWQLAITAARRWTVTPTNSARRRRSLHSLVMRCTERIGGLEEAGECCAPTRFSCIREQAPSYSAFGPRRTLLLGASASTWPWWRARSCRCNVGRRACSGRRRTASSRPRCQSLAWPGGSSVGTRRCSRSCPAASTQAKWLCRRTGRRCCGPCGSSA
mmetsp:Transcript_42192/g.106260  ORF Transcript_42192/g.106260 Transcript_42192/m.106260 type:complete len:223 (-) Transcript_42192:632-1300(-)